MFRQQLRAILRASAYGKVNILFPMVGQMGEIRQALDALARVRQQLDESGKVYSHVAVGAMIEVPAAAIAIDRFLKYFDFVSIGTNDLIQYTLAIDRADEAVAHLFDPWHPAVLHLLHHTISRCHAMGRGISVCGEMAGDPAFTELLLAMGLRSFSMHPARIAAIKQRVLRCDVRTLSSQLAVALSAEDPQTAWLQAMLPRVAR